MIQKTCGIENKIGDYSRYVVVAKGGENIVYADIYESGARKRRIGDTTFNLSKLQEEYQNGIGTIADFKELERVIAEAEKAIEQNTRRK